MGNAPVSLAFNTIYATVPSSPWAIFEVYDPFFCNLKHTAVCPARLGVEFEGDIDLMDSHGKVLLGPA